MGLLPGYWPWQQASQQAEKWKHLESSVSTAMAWFRSRAWYYSSRACRTGYRFPHIWPAQDVIHGGLWGPSFILISVSRQKTKVPLLSLSYLSHCSDQNAWPKGLKWEGFRLAPCLRGSPPWRESTAAGAWGGWSHYVHSQEEETWEHYSWAGFLLSNSVMHLGCIFPPELS